MSAGPFGTVFGVQLAAVFQSPLTGLALQVALPANEWAAIKHEREQNTGKSLFILPSQQKSAAISSQTGLGVSLPDIQNSTSNVLTVRWRTLFVSLVTYPGSSQCLSTP